MSFLSMGLQSCKVKYLDKFSAPTSKLCRFIIKIEII